MKEEKKPSSGFPLILIVGVLVAVIVGAFFLYRSSNGTAGPGKPSPTPAAQPTLPPNNAPGAQPPNAMGAPTAAVVMEEFADYQCGSCAASFPVIKEVTKAYAGNPNFRFVFRNFPLQMHDKAYDAAVAAEAAGMQNPAKFWLMQEQLFTNQQNWSINQNYREMFNDYAQKIGLDVERLKTDMAGLAAKSRVDLDLTRGRGFSVSSTPTVIINNKVIPYNQVTVAGLRRIIDMEMQAANTPQQQSAPASSANAANK
jgi:protein-disulfide isomerase